MSSQNSSTGPQSYGSMTNNRSVVEIWIRQSSGRYVSSPTNSVSKPMTAAVRRCATHSARADGESTKVSGSSAGRNERRAMGWAHSVGEAGRAGR